MGEEEEVFIELAGDFRVMAQEAYLRLSRSLLTFCAIIPQQQQSALASRSEALSAITTRTAMELMNPMSGMKPLSPKERMDAPKRWWPQQLGENPSSAGCKNQRRFAFFGDKRRLATDTGFGKSGSLILAIIAFLACSKTRAVTEEK